MSKDKKGHAPGYSKIKVGEVLQQPEITLEEAFVAFAGGSMDAFDEILKELRNIKAGQRMIAEKLGLIEPERKVIIL